MIQPSGCDEAILCDTRGGRTLGVVRPDHFSLTISRQVGGSGSLPTQAGPAGVRAAPGRFPMPPLAPSAGHPAPLGASPGCAAASGCSCRWPRRCPRASPRPHGHLLGQVGQPLLQLLAIVLQFVSPDGHDTIKLRSSAGGWDTGLQELDERGQVGSGGAGHAGMVGKLAVGG